MEIFINDEIHSISDDTTVYEVVNEMLRLESAGMAIAINDKIVPKPKWDTTVFENNDKMLLIKACKGG